MEAKYLKLFYKKYLKKIFREGSFDANEIIGEKKLVHTIDIISSIVDDLFLLGKIAAKHSLNDLIAANSNLISAQMMLGIPLSLNKIQKRDIYQLKEGANTVFNELGNSISGGHSYSLEEGKYTIGFSLIGKKNQILKKQYNKEKLNIYMTGKVGTALVMAGIKNKIISGNFIMK